MEVRVRERLVGALVLVAIVVLVVPAILEGRGPQQAEPAGQMPTRRVEVPIGDTTPPPEEQVLVPEPALPEATAPDAEVQKPAPEPTAPEPQPRAAKPPAVAPAAPPSQATAVREQPAPRPSRAATAWAVQLGAFSNRSKAEQLVADLQKRRYAAFILEYRASGQVLYRVRVGPEQDRARAAEIAERLAKDGYEPVVARHP